MRRSGVVAILLLASLALPRLAPGAADTGRGQAAATLFARAEAAFAALKADARAQRQRRNFTRVLEDYRRVFEKHAATRQAERALLRAGELHTLLYRWTGQEGDLNQAQHYYQRLLQDYPKSALRPDAQLAIAYLFLNHFKDPEQAWLKFRDVTALARGGQAVAEAKRQLRRLARYAPPPQPPQPPAPQGGEADPSCPAPAPAAAAAPARKPGASAGALPAVLNRIRDIRHWSNPEYSRVVIDLDAQTNFYSNLLVDRSDGGKPPRLYVDLFNSQVEERLCRPISVNDGILLGIRPGQFTPDSVRVVLDIDRLQTYRVFPMQNPFRIVIDVTGGAPAAAPAAVAAGAPTAQPAGEPSAAVPATSPDDRESTAPPSAASVPAPVPELLPLPPLWGSPGAPPAPEVPRAVSNPPPREIVAAAPPPVLAAAPPARKPPVPAKPARDGPPPPPAAPALPAGKLSLARQLGLGVRRVVIDAGHGAHDPGAIGIGGLQEKEVTLDLALRVRKVLQAAGYDTVLTRDRDVYLPLEERTALANTARGDLFLSLHCNASDRGNLSGVETYYLNLASGQRAMATAARENSMALANMSDLQDLLKEIYNSKMDESSRFAEAVQRALHGSLRRKHRDVKDLGVKQAPFYVLIGAQMPSILVEVSFINHAAEGRRLKDPAYRQIIAQAIADGVRRYVKTVKTAAAEGPRGSTP